MQTFNELITRGAAKVWAPVFKKALASNPNLSPEKILRMLELEYRVDTELQKQVSRDEYGAPIYPDVRTLARWKVLYAKQLKAQWFDDLYSWPSSHQNGDIPWEQAPMALEIARSRQKMINKPPTIRQLQWAWWLHQSAPDCPITGDIEFQGYIYQLHWNIETVSEQLAMMQDMRPVHVMRPLTESTRPAMFISELAPDAAAISFLDVVEQWLMWAPWRSKALAEEYLFNERFHSDTVRESELLLPPQLFIDFALAIPSAEAWNFEYEEDGETYKVGDVGNDGHFAIYMPRYESIKPLVPTNEILALRRPNLIQWAAPFLFGYEELPSEESDREQD